LTAVCTNSFVVVVAAVVVVVDVPYEFRYGDGVLANKSVLFDLDKVIATSLVQRLDRVNWFNRHYGVCVLELVIYTPYSDLLSQVCSSRTVNTGNGAHSSLWIGNPSQSYGASPAIWDHNHTVLLATQHR